MKLRDINQAKRFVMERRNDSLIVYEGPVSSRGTNKRDIIRKKKIEEGNRKFRRQYHAWLRQKEIDIHLGRVIVVKTQPAR